MIQQEISVSDEGDFGVSRVSRVEGRQVQTVQALQFNLFNRSFSSTVGPDGNGKSNTFEMLLVSGKRAKKMGLHRVSDLIHSPTYAPNLSTVRIEV